MRRRRFMLFSAIVGVSVALASCGLAGESLPDYRYRLTLEVDTPEGLRTGSSVIEVSTGMTDRYSIPDPGKVILHHRGEAVAVDLGERGVLFALLRSETEVDWPNSVMFLLAPDNEATGREGFRQRFDAMLANRDVMELPRTFPDVGHLTDRPALPMLVRFRDLNDPTTIKKVDPDDFAESFGDGVKLRRITVQITDDPVTTGIRNRLVWLGNMRGNYDNEEFPKDIPLGNLSGIFSTEFE